jgi:hypothetical protein
MSRITICKVLNAMRYIFVYGGILGFFVFVSGIDNEGSVGIFFITGLIMSIISLFVGMIVETIFVNIYDKIDDAMFYMNKTVNNKNTTVNRHRNVNKMSKRPIVVAAAATKKVNKTNTNQINHKNSTNQNTHKVNTKSTYTKSEYQKYNEPIYRKEA